MVKRVRKPKNKVGTGVIPLAAGYFALRRAKDAPGAKLKAKQERPKLYRGK